MKAETYGWISSKKRRRLSPPSKPTTAKRRWVDISNLLSYTDCHHAFLTPGYVEDFLIALRDGNVGRHSHTLDILLALKREDSSRWGFGYRPTEATCGSVRTSLGLS
jgi:hypothetical protein